MRTAWWVPGVLMAACAVSACGDATAPTPTPDPLRTFLYYDVDAGQTLLVNSDGSDVHPLALGADSVAPFAVAPGGAALAFLGPNAILITSLSDPSRLDTAISPLPAGDISLASFSPDQRFLGLISYSPTPVLLVYDRANRRLDTLPAGDVEPVLPPVFAPDNNRIGIIGATELSMFITIVPRNNVGGTHTNHLGFSRFLNRPIFGWPVWTAEGLILAVVRVADAAPDTVLSVSIDADHPERDAVERYRAVLAPVSDERPKVRFGVQSTYSYASDGEGLALAAQPNDNANRHALYYVSRAVPRVRLVLDNPAAFPAYPLVIN